MFSISSTRNSRGNVLIYTLMLAFFGTIAASLLFTKSETLVQNATVQRVESKSSKNLDTKADLAIKYSMLLNSNGGGFNDTLSCPTNYRLRNISTSTDVFTVSTTPQYWVSGLYCAGNHALVGDFTLSYASGSTTFEKTEIAGNSLILSVSWGNTVSTTFIGAGWSTYQVIFTTPTIFSGLDRDGDSDNQRATSTGGILYPGGKTDDDALARQVMYGYIKKNIGPVSVLWSNKKTNAYVAQNPLNIDSVYRSIGDETSGVIYLSVDGPYTLKITEFDRNRYTTNGELYVLTGSSITTASGAMGYIQDNLTLSGSYGSTASLATAKRFDFKNKDYALFLSYPGNPANPSADFLRYQIKASSLTGANLYITPIQDSLSGEIRYYSNDILIADDGKFVASEGEITKKDPTGRTLWATASGSNYCNFDSSFFGCLFY